MQVEKLPVVDMCNLKGGKSMVFFFFLNVKLSYKVWNAAGLFLGQ